MISILIQCVVRLPILPSMLFVVATLEEEEDDDDDHVIVFR